MCDGGEVVSAGAEAPTDFVTNLINAKEAFALSRVFCTIFPGRLREHRSSLVSTSNP